MKRSDKRRCTSFPDADINKYQKNVTKVLQRCFDPDPESSSVDNRNAAEAPTPQVKLKTAPPSVRSRVSGSRSRASRDSSVTSGTGSKKAGKPPNFALTANCPAKSVCKKVKKKKSNSFNEKLPSTANCNLLDPPKNISKEDRIEVNLNNISYNSKVRLTIKDLHCEETVNNDPCCESSCSVVTDTFIQQLKNEIKNNQVKCTQSCGVGGGSQATHFDYVERLQEEIVVNKANCLEANKRQVEALKREICRYRMNMAVNSHLDSNERQFEADLDNLDEKANVADLPENAEIDG